MELPFTQQGHRGRVVVSVATTLVPAALGAREGAIDLANCTATIEFAGRGYLQLLGWVQLVRSSDNAFHGRQFEMDPFDPFGLYERAPSPYCWYGIAPTLLDAPSRDERSRLDWIAHSFLAASPLRGNRRIVTPLLGFSWGFDVADNGSVALKPVTSLTAADWEAHLPYLRGCYAEWQFTAMPIPGGPSGGL
jgi:hypothetical protein